MTALPDGNVLVGLVVEDHVHHRMARRWFTATDEPFLTCPITQGTLVRLSMRYGAPLGDALAALADLVRHPRHRFIADDVGYLDIDVAGVIGNRQVTDAYMVALARRHGAVVATFDQGLAAIHPDVTELIA